MKTNSGIITNIQHFSVDDGPGIRTTVFLKGCPLSCAWCHNPETHACKSELMYHAARCIGCRRCLPVCPQAAHGFADGMHRFDRSRCLGCFACTGVCPSSALEKVGREMSVSEVLEEVLSDRVFYARSGGGITLSGGEPLAQADFAAQLLLSCKRESLHTCVETCGFGSQKALLELAAHTDLFLFDWKLTDPELHERFTGVSNRTIEENLALLCQSGAKIILRCPMIPGVNLNPAHYNGIAALSRRHAAICEIHLEPYHPLGAEKSRALGKTPAFADTEFFSASALTDARTYIAALVSVPVKILS